MDPNIMRKSSFIVSVLLLMIVPVWMSCDANYSPRDKDYPRVNFPEKKYQMFDKDYCPFKFEYPVYANLLQDTTFFEGKPENPCWLNLHYPQFAATVHMNYKDLVENYNLAKLQEDAHRLTYKHSKRADYIKPDMVQNDTLIGLFYNVGGDAASAIQFYVTDTTEHFLRGALYFQTAPNIDSLKPIVNFIGDDIMHLIATLKWDN